MHSARRSPLVRLSYDALVALIQSTGRQDASEELVLRLTPRLHGYIRSRLDASAAEDVLQDVLAAVAKSIATGHDPSRGPVDHWAIRIAHNKVLDHYRRARPVESLDAREDRGAELAAKGDPIEDALDRQIAFDAARVALELLTPVRRSMLVLRYFHGLSYAEIATQLGTTTGTVKTELNRALRSLRANPTMQAYSDAA